MRRDVFQAIADPTRREIIRLVAKQSLNVNAVAEQFDISRPAVSKHMKILEECGLVEIRDEGRERYCTAKLDGLREVSGWVEQYRELWDTQLNNLDNYLQGLQGKDTSSTTTESSPKNKQHGTN